MTSAAPHHIIASRTLPGGPGAVVRELLVRVGDVEARAFTVPGQAPERWTVRRTNRWNRTVDLGEMRRTIPGGGWALAKACVHVARAA